MSCRGSQRTSDVASWGLENHVNLMARRTELELDVKIPQWTKAQFPSGETLENPQCGAKEMKCHVKSKYLNVASRLMGERRGKSLDGGRFHS